MSATVTRDDSGDERDELRKVEKIELLPPYRDMDETGRAALRVR